MSFISNDYPDHNTYMYHNHYPYMSGKNESGFLNRDTRTENGKMILNGTGIIRVQPDIATVILGVVTESMELRNAQQENAEKIQRIIDTLVRMGIAERDIETEAYSIVPQYDYPEGTQVFRGYRVTNNLKVTIRDIKRVGEIVDAAVASGANIVYNVSFTIADPSNTYRRALSQAVVDAIYKASAIEQTLKIIVDKTPDTVEEESIGMGITRERDEFLAPIAATPIITGQIEVVARIKATFSYRKALR